MVKIDRFTKLPYLDPFINVSQFSKITVVKPSYEAFKHKKLELKSLNGSKMRIKRKVGPITFLP